MLFITLPSGRKLTYVKPRIGENKFGGESVTYEGIGATKKWERLESYGPKFVENVVQAISRDLLMNAMKTLSHCFICGHVHDKLIIECSEKVSLKVLCSRWQEHPTGCRISCFALMATSQNFIKKTNENGSTDHSDRYCHYVLFIQFCNHSFKDFINLTGALSILEGAITKMIFS